MSVGRGSDPLGRQRHSVGSRRVQTVDGPPSAGEPRPLSPPQLGGSPQILIDSRQGETEAQCARQKMKVCSLTEVDVNGKAASEP